MAVDSSLAGRTFPPTEPYTVTADAVSAFAAAAGSSWSDGDPAPATFPIVVSFTAMTDLMKDPSAGIALQNVIHGDQKFVYRRPVRIGDVLTATLTVDSLRQIAGTDIIATTSAVTDADGELVVEAKATLIHRSPEGDQ